MNPNIVPANPVAAARPRNRDSAGTFVGAEIVGWSPGHPLQARTTFLTEHAGRIILVAALATLVALHSGEDFAGLEISAPFFSVDFVSAGFAAFAAGTAFLFGGLLVTFASVIGDIKAASLENQTRAGPQKAADLPLAPFLHAAMGFRTDGESILLHGLEDLESLPALFTFVFVGRHLQIALSGIQ